MPLDDNLDIKLCDFQGKVLNPDSIVQLGGLSSEDAKSSILRSDSNVTTRKTDIFALESVIYFTIEDHLLFEDLDSLNNAEQIADKFRSGQLSALNDVQVREVVYKCWAGQYETAEEVEDDLKKIKLI